MIWDVRYTSEEARQILTGPRLPSNYSLFDAWEISNRSDNNRDYAIFWKYADGKTYLNLNVIEYFR